MIKLHAIQAHEGDCLLVEHEQASKRRFVLIDGGPKKTYDPYLESTLRNRVSKHGGRIDLAVVSHVDEDHVFGLLDLFTELRSARSEGRKPYVNIAELWHNTFGLLDPEGEVARRYRSLMTIVNTLHGAQTEGPSPELAHALSDAHKDLTSIAQGARLGRQARLLGVPINKRFGGASIVASGDRKTDTRTIQGLRIRVVGPTQANLDALRKEWMKWLRKQERALREGSFSLAAMKDKSKRNLSSLQLLVQKGGKRILLTGDGRGDHLQEALDAAGYADGKIHVDVLKVPHHGSNRNVTPKFFREVTADTYVISGNGKHDNPDLDTLQWIAEAAKARSQKIDIVVTNRPKSVREFVDQFPTSRYPYRLRVRSSSRKYVTVSV